MFVENKNKVKRYSYGTMSFSAEFILNGLAVSKGAG